MKCSNCNVSIEGNPKFCPECGAKLVSEPILTASESTPTAPIKKRKKGVVVLIVVLAVVLVSAITWLLWYNYPNWVCAIFGHSLYETRHTPSCEEDGYFVIKCDRHCWYYDIEYPDEEWAKSKGHEWIDATTSSPQTCKTCKKTKGKPLTAFQALNEEERRIYYALLHFSDKLKDPFSLILINVKLGFTSANATEKSVFVKVSANNSFGAAVSDVYVITNGVLNTAGSGWYNAAGAWNYMDSVSKINAALQEHFNDMK